jgi:hypothetical protein
MKNPKYILSFIGLTNHIYPGQNAFHFDNNIKIEVSTPEEIEAQVKKHYAITRPEEFSSEINLAISLLNNSEWKKGWNIRQYRYKLVNNSGNPTLCLELKN